MDKQYFSVAFLEAKKAFEQDEVPIGAVIVKDGNILASAHNQKEKDCCCTSHAEILAIQQASSKLHNWRLEDCDLYVTLDPCPMCASAIKQARIRNVYSCLNNNDFHNLELIQSIFQTDSVNPEVHFESNLEVQKGKEILSEFFKKQRKR